MRAPVAILFFLTLLSRPAWAIDVQEQIIKRDQWPQYVTGSSVSALPQAQSILQKFSESDKVSIVIQYPGGETGASWARQMYQWFVAYGVPGKYLKMELGSGAPDQLRLLLVNKN